MKYRQILIFGLVGGVLITLLKVVEYRFLVLTHSFEIYGGLVALVFASFGIWLGGRVTGRPVRTVVREVQVMVPAPDQPVVAPGPFVVNGERQAALGITRRELEILELIAAGLSNKEIAERIFVSENTVKTHASRLLEKLNARRRTQAVQVAKAQGLLP